jgi:hypothetical protein
VGPPREGEREEGEGDGGSEQAHADRG